MNKRLAMVTRALTGHTHYRSPYEGYDDCGTCDGARCECCREKWEVTYFGPDDKKPELFNTKEEAIAAQEEYEKGGEA